jgi:hypothetical protein
MKYFLILALLLPTFVFALEVDEKLTARIVKTSESKKTVMVNRGTEDGLVEGDHAKFIVTAGIIARGVVVRVSPTRSVWSVYRLVNADFVTNDSVISLKITPPVKITKDESKALVQEDTPTTVSGDPTQLGIPLADGANDMAAAGNTDASLNSADLKALEANDVPASIVEKNKEIYAFLNISGLTSNSKTDVGDQSYNNSQSFHHIGVGGELYPQREREWYSRFSLVGGVALMRENSQAYNGAGVTNDYTEFSFGTNWHPTKMPSVAGDFIPYLHASFHIGTAKSTYKRGSEVGTTEELDSTGGTSGFSIGGGYKFYTFKGFGARVLLDYYMRSEKYKEDTLINTHNKKTAGPRFMVALSYRF